MPLVDLCEPIFQYICRLNRSARKGGNYDRNLVEAEVRSLLADAKKKAVSQNLADQFNKIELPLVFFCDSMIKESSLPWAYQWNELAAERRETGGGKRFFDMLEETLRDKSEAATERLAVFYTCIGLGFTGAYTGKHEFLQQKMREISARLSGGGQFHDTQRICADAYEKVDTRDLIEPPARKLVGIAIAAVGLILVLFIAYALLFYDNSRELRGALQTVKEKSTANTGSVGEAGK